MRDACHESTFSPNCFAFFPTSCTGISESGRKPEKTETVLTTVPLDSANAYTKRYERDAPGQLACRGVQHHAHRRPEPGSAEPTCNGSPGNITQLLRRGPSLHEPTLSRWDGNREKSRNQASCRWAVGSGFAHRSAIPKVFTMRYSSSLPTQIPGPIVYQIIVKGVAELLSLYG